MIRGVSSVGSLLLFAAALAHAQTSSSLTGVVTDAHGSVLPRAAVFITHKATGETLEALTNTVGHFSFPVLPLGTYRVRVSLAGFKTFVANDVRLEGAQPASLTATLALGPVTEKTEVKGHAGLIQTQSATVTSALAGERLRELPLSTRNALHALLLLPGVNTTRGPREALINGVPNTAINVTIDGITTSSMFNPLDGLASLVTPRLDAVEQVTVTGAVPGATSGRNGVQIAITTRSGSNHADGSGYYYWRDPKLNSNYFFNRVNKLPKNRVILHQYGMRQGGPVRVPGIFDGRGKAFFFFNFERSQQPSSVNRTRSLLRPEAQAGIFSYNVNVGGVLQRRTVDLATLAQTNGQSATFNSTVVRVLNEIRQASSTTGRVNDIGSANLLQYVYQSEATLDQYAPIGRVDINLTPQHRLSASYWWQRFTGTADLQANRDALWPGLPNYGIPNWYRTTGSSTLRSTFGRSLVNSLVGGWQWSPNDPSSNVTPDQFANQDGYGLIFPIGTSPTVVTSRRTENTTVFSLDDTLSWLRGKHSWSVGFGYSGLRYQQTSKVIVPRIELGFDPNRDPARGMFNSVNFPSATGAHLTEARALYALLTGRVSRIPASASLDSAASKYVYNGDLTHRLNQNSFSAFAQDTWRLSPTLTFNGGLRWDLHLPFAAATDTFSVATLEDACGISGVGPGVGGRRCRLFQPGASGGQLTPTFDPLPRGQPAYQANWTDLAPNVGVAWRPNAQTGWLRRLLGDPEQFTLRAGYGVSYVYERIGRPVFNFGNNPRAVIDATRSNNGRYPVIPPGETAPALFSERHRLGAPAFPEAPVYPLTAEYVFLFSQDGRLRTPRVDSFSAGIQRSIGRDTALEMRYVGTRNVHMWREEEWNEPSIFENGFMDEFRAAQRNIAINAAAGLHTFAFTGLPGTAPLPIHLAYLTGRRDAGNPEAYAGSSYFNDLSVITLFSPLNPNPYEAVAGLVGLNDDGSAAGYPLNFFVLNPMAPIAVVVMQDKEWTKYHSLQIDLRRRMAQEFFFNANYTYGLQWVSLLETLRLPRIERPAFNPANVPHALKMNWVYELPIGRSRRFGRNMHPALDALLGNWQYSGTSRVQSVVRLLGGVALEGMTVKDLQKEFRLRIERDAAGVVRFFSLPEDIRVNTAAAFSVDPTTPTGYSTALGPPSGRYLRPVGGPGCMTFYGHCSAPDITLRAPLFTRWDMRLKKGFQLRKRANAEFVVEVLNVFDSVNFNLFPGVSSDSNSVSRVSSGYTEINTTLDPGGRIGQLAWRLNW